MSTAVLHATEARDSLYRRFADRICANPSLSRKLVSYQGNKKVPGLRWLKYKEGFSADLVRGLLHATGAKTFLDPFSGSGTAPLTAGSMGMDATGIEVMPVGNLLAQSISIASNGLEREDLYKSADGFLQTLERDQFSPEMMFPHIPITQNAFPEETERELAQAREYLSTVTDNHLRTVLNLACVSVLEEISYTRKDGQFLRWDPQSGRDVKTKLHKPTIPSLSEAFGRRVMEIADDLSVLKVKYGGTAPKFIEGSCLDELQYLPDERFDVVLTSPPYANRYDYTRTYALELAYMGYDAKKLKELRQTLLSATVENRSKRELLRSSNSQVDRASLAIDMADQQPALQEALSALRAEAQNLSNRNVIKLVENYFTEMAVVVVELARLVSPGGHVFMVNDNVRYHGEEIPVDLILSDFAEQCGFRCDSIWTLNRGKGNSSQQMGRFGRQELRKCVYLWRKLDG